MRRVLAVLFSGLLLASLIPASAHADFDDYALESAESSLSSYQAGAHADFVTSFVLTTDGTGAPDAETRDVQITLPPGLIGDPAAFPKCTAVELGPNPPASECPIDAQVGVAELEIHNPSTTVHEPIYNMPTPGGNVVARLGFFAALFPEVINVRVHPEDDYRLTATVEGAAAAAGLVRATTTIWGVPALPRHDAERVTPAEAEQGELPPGGGRSSTLPPVPFLSNPTRCGVPLEVGISAVSYQRPEMVSAKTLTLPALSGCGSVAFQPSFDATPTSREAAAPTGLEVDLGLSQDPSAEGLSTSQLRDAAVTFPEGLTLAPGVAASLGSCDAREAGYQAAGPSTCPNAAKIGTAEIDVPVLERPLQAGIYQRTPEPGHLFRIWLIADDLGVHVALPGEVEVNKTTGQIVATFSETPQVPLRTVKLHIFGGSHGPFANPSACGSYSTHYEFTPWSGAPIVSGDTPMKIDQNCATGGFSPALEAGTENPSAGVFSPFILRIAQQTGEQNLAGFEMTLPEGVLAKLKGVELCPEQDAAGASCPPGSQVGSAQVAVGPGPSPLLLPQPGRGAISVYLAGPYKSAPYSLIVRAPAQAGPFDLGTVVVRQALYINPQTTQVTVKSDPLPQILEGVPISYRSVYATIDRPEFTVNPTNCEAAAVNGTLVSSTGARADASDRFQVGSCAGLGFKPKLKISLKGSTRRAGHPALKAVLTYPKAGAYANIARAQVNLPHSEFIDQANLDKTCTKPVLLAGNCPASTMYGKVKAWTPLLEKPLEGPVYLVGGFGYKLPALVAELNGQIRVLLVGKVDSGPNQGIRNTFEAVPDAPVSRFVLEMEGGPKYSLLENSENLCAKPQRAIARLTAQNGMVEQTKPLIANQCGAPHEKAKKRHKRPHHASRRNGDANRRGAASLVRWARAAW